MSPSVGSSTQILGINTSDWGHIAVEAASMFCPVIDIYRGGHELLFDEKADKFNAALKLGFGVMGTIPFVGGLSGVYRVGSKLLGAEAKFALRAAEEMTAPEKINKVLGVVQYFMTPLFLGGSIMGGIHSVEGLRNWDKLNSSERKEVLETVLFSLGMPALGFAHG